MTKTKPTKAKPAAKKKKTEAVVVLAGIRGAIAAWELGRRPPSQIVAQIVELLRHEGVI